MKNLTVLVDLAKGKGVSEEEVHMVLVAFRSSALVAAQKECGVTKEMITVLAEKDISAVETPEELTKIVNETYVTSSGKVFSEVYDRIFNSYLENFIEKVKKM